MYKPLHIFLCLLVLSCRTAFAQTGELDNIDCLYSKEVVIPFNYSGDANADHFTPVLNQTVFYSYRDQFSYWYKVIIKENAALKFKITPINDSDTYAVYLYQYNQPDFCKNAFNQKVKPVKSSVYSGHAPEDEFDLNERSFNASKNNTYYICVLNTSINNCGHTLRLVNGKDTLLVKAIHLPCKRTISALAVKTAPKKNVKTIDTIPKPVTEPVVIKETVKTPTVMPVAVPTTVPVATPSVAFSQEQTLICYIKDSKKKTVVDGKLTIIDQTTGDQLITSHTHKGEYSCVLERGKSYKLKCNAFGYKNTDIIYEFKTDDGLQTKQLDVWIEPLKEGDNFIMKSIYFYPNTYALKKESADELQKLLTFLTENETVVVEIQGHTNGDNRIFKNKAYAGLSEEWNFQGSAQKLSQKRAEAIKSYLETNGISANRLIAKGLGGEKPIIKDPETNEEGQRNIRVEIVILKN